MCKNIKVRTLDTENITGWVFDTKPTHVTDNYYKQQ